MSGLDLRYLLVGGKAMSNMKELFCPSSSPRRCSASRLPRHLLSPLFPSPEEALMAGQEGAPKKDDGAGGSSKPAPVGGDSSTDSTDPVEKENIGLENPDTVLQDVPRDATVAEQGKGSGSAPSTGSADKGKEAGGSHGIVLGKGKEVVGGQASAVPGDVSAHAGTGVDGDASNIQKMTALVAELPHFPPAPQAPSVLDKGKSKRKSDGQGSRTGSKREKGTDPRAKDNLWYPTAEDGPEIKDLGLQLDAAASAVKQGLHLQSPLARIPVPSAPLPPRFQPGAELCLECHRGPALTSLFVGHHCLCPPCHQVIQGNPISTPCLVCRAQVIADPPPQ